MARNGWLGWCRPRVLHQRGVLGINARNLRYLAQCNPRHECPLVDDKILTKRLCAQRGLPVPETYTVIDRFGDVRRFMDRVGNHREFAVKPARGAAGRGILVVTGRGEAGFETTAGATLSWPELRYHISSILSGLYSLCGHTDRVIVEERLVADGVFRPIAIGGTPDIRTIVYRGVPVMAMLRLPTRASRGRANLHQGAVGVGVDLATGRTIGGVCRNRAVSRHPDTAAPVEGVQIPAWAEVLSIAARLSSALNLGYVGVDIVLDARRGPIVLEANARPGLGVQIANRTGLLQRLRRVDAAPPREPAAVPPAAVSGLAGSADTRAWKEGPGRTAATPLPGPSIRS